MQHERLANTLESTSAASASAAPCDPEFARWWTTADVGTGMAPSACLDFNTAQKAWEAARALFAPLAQPSSGKPPDHEIREAVNQLRDVARQFHNTQQLRSRIQDIVLPLVARKRAL